MFKITTGHKQKLVRATYQIYCIIKTQKKKYYIQALTFSTRTTEIEFEQIQGTF